MADPLLILPNRGEFGLKVMYHVPAVHAIEHEKIVFAEPGEDCLYPSASKIITVPSQPDDNMRRGMQERDGDFHEQIMKWYGYLGDNWIETDSHMPRKRFVPSDKGHHRWGAKILGDYFAPDVVVCPRRRQYGATKNWPWWFALVKDLKAESLEVVSAGRGETSYHVACPNDRIVVDIIAQMKLAKFVIATDAGLAHLALLVGADLLLITHGDGLVAPGPVLDPDGKPMQDAYGPVRWDRYDEGNHAGAEVRVVKDAWDEPRGVYNAAMKWLEEKRDG